MQEIQEALDERQNNLDSLLAHNQVNIPLEQPFAFESQVDTDTHPINSSLKSTDGSFQPPIESGNNISNETVPLLAAPNEKENKNKQSEIDDRNCQQKSNWTLAKDSINIKKEPITPPKPKPKVRQANSKRKKLSSISPMHQMTMTQLFDRIESPKLNTNSTPIKQEPNTPSDDTIIFMPESLIGLAEPSESMSDTENEQNNLSNPISPFLQNNSSNKQSLKRKSIPDETITTDEEDNIQNEALLQSPSSIENEELLYACPMCRNYWLGLPEELRRKESLTCRHRQRPVVRTPEHFWSLGIPSTQTCIQRGYGGVLPPDKPIERPRRPRRQYQRKLQEQQEQEIEEIDNEEE